MKAIELKRLIESIDDNEEVLFCTGTGGYVYEPTLVIPDRGVHTFTGDYFKASIAYGGDCIGAI